MCPECSKDFVCVVTILELLIKLVRSASVCYSTVESNESKGEIFKDNTTLFKLFMDDSSFWIMEEGEDHLNKASSEIGVGYYLLLAE